jgi:O-antigen/teichoic acid export membrane protein
MHYLRKLLNLLDRLIIKIVSGHPRSVRALKNIIASFAIKGISIIVGFLMVPLCLDYLDQSRYGIWLIMTSFLGWFGFFEIGLGAGLRNKLAETLAIQDYQKGRIYVSTTYAILAIIAVVIAGVFALINPHLNWVSILNADAALINELKTLSLIVFNFFFLKFVLRLVIIVLYADQKPAFANSIGPVSNLVSFIIIYILTKTTDGSLIYMGAVLSIIPVFAMFLLSVFLFLGKYRFIAPSIKHIQFKYSSELLNLGLKFFFIQVSGLIMYQTSNIIITQFYGPALVTTYNIAYKLFSVMSMIFALIMMPFWSAFTEAWALNDHQWIKNSISKLVKTWLVMVAVGFILLIFSPWIYKYWVGEDITIPFSLSLILFIYFSLYTFGGVFNMFINGVGKLHLQLYASIVGAISFIPLAILFLKYMNMGIEGLVLATIIANFYGPFLTPLQYKKLISGSAKGIWNR